MKKKFLFTVLSSLFLTSVVAQAQSLAVDYLRTGELQIAKQIFSNEVAQTPAASNYYLGEIAYSEGKLDVAKDFYNKAIAADPEYSLAYVGLGKLYLKSSNVKEAEDAFSSALKKNKKDVSVNVAIAEAYFANGDEAKANLKIEDALKIDKKSPLPYVLQGEILESKGNPGEAAGKYDMANYFDPNYTLAYLKSSKVYEGINSELAIEKLKKVLEINPNYSIAYRDLGKIYTTNGFYAQAIEAYLQYFKHKTYSVADITKFASDYYFTKKYDDAILLLKEGLAIEPDNFVLNRLYMYSLADSKNYAEALPVAQKFFSLEAKKTDKILQDYMSYGDILAKNNQLTAAIDQYNAAIAIDPSKVTVYKDIASAFSESNKYAEAAEYYDKYITKVDTTLLETSDFYTMGRYYYYAASGLKDSTSESAKEKVKSYLKGADQAFATVSVRKPDTYLGYLWRARTNAMLDPETTEGLAKPYYEQTAAVIAAKDGGSTNNKTELTESYRYLAYYYYLKADKANSIDFCNKLLSIDPENQTAKAILGDLSKK
jgi:tetratricopeptide (TPR) repeat protein